MVLLNYIGFLLGAIWTSASVALILAKTIEAYGFLSLQGAGSLIGYFLVSWSVFVQLNIVIAKMLGSQQPVLGRRADRAFVAHRKPIKAGEWPERLTLLLCLVVPLVLALVIVRM